MNVTLRIWLYYLLQLRLAVIFLCIRSGLSTLLPHGRLDPATHFIPTPEDIWIICVRVCYVLYINYMNS